MKGINPKAAFGAKKPSLLSAFTSAILHSTLAHMDGDMKYGFRNWRETRVLASTYYNAMLRHILLASNGEKYTRDTKIRNLGAVIACCNILLDAELHDMLDDDIPASKETCDLLHSMEDVVQFLKDRNAPAEHKAVPVVGDHNSKDEFWGMPNYLPSWVLT